jgi:hypothetical protein
MNVIKTVRQRFSRWTKNITLSKRQQFIVVTFILTAGLLLTQLAGAEFRYPMVVGLSILTYALAAFALREDLKKVEWLTLLTLPTLFTAAVATFYFLLPVRWLTRIPVALLYAVGMYGLLLTENIYNVAANRTIALLRAAHSVGFLLTLVTFFLLVQTLLAFRLPGIINAILCAAIAWALIVQSLWAMELDVRIGKRVWQLSAALSLAIAQITLSLSFWPVKTTLLALFLTTFFYSTTGMAQQYVSDRLYKRTVIEFFAVTFFVLCIVLLTTRWRGNL